MLFQSSLSTSLYMYYTFRSQKKKKKSLNSFGKYCLFAFVFLSPSYGCYAAVARTVSLSLMSLHTNFEYIYIFSLFSGTEGQENI